MRIEDVPSVRLSWLSSFDRTSLSNLLEESPESSVWIPETGEYVLGGHWRGRPDIGIVHEVGGRKNRRLIVDFMFDDFAAAGCAAAVFSANEVWRQGRWYRQNGFQELDLIVTMVRSETRVLPPRSDALEIRDFSPLDLDALTLVDRESFPWLWWNDPLDFMAYSNRPEVHVQTGWRDGEMVAYAATTRRAGRGHLDRLAVRRSDQGKGLGRAMLITALDLLVSHGAREIALTTQTTNTVAMSLYRSVGFRRTSELEPIIGRVFQSL